MKIIVLVKPRSKKTSVEKLADGRFKVGVKEPPEGGRANAAAGKALAGFFSLPQSEVKLVRGSSSRRKIFEIPFG